MKDKLFLRLCASRRNLLAAALVFAASAFIFGVEWRLAFYENLDGHQEPCWWYLWTYGGLTVLSAALCLVELDISPAAGHRLGWALVLALPVWAFVTVDVINGTKLWSFPHIRWAANYLCYLLVFALGYALTRRAWGAAVIGGAVALTFGIANYFVVQFRGQPILPWDFQSLSTALTVSGGYEYTPTRKMTVAVMSYLCAITACMKLSPKSRPEAARRVRRAERLCALAVALAVTVVLLPLNGLENMGISVWSWNQKASSELTGIAAGFFANVQYMLVDRPEGYSLSKVNRLAQAQAQDTEPAPLGRPGGRPTIIAIMNESMTDLGSFGTLQFEPDNMPLIHGLQKSGTAIWGTAYSSVYGGNTCNSEYEFLSGNSMSFLPNGSKPYQQYVDSPQTALPSILKSYGYHCVAVHPGDRDAWQRMEAYPHMGFDEFVDAEIFDVKRSFEHRLTSDRSCYEQLIYEYERWNEVDGSPLFLFNVTIQNHGGYEDENYRTQVRVEGFEGQWPRAEQYLTLTKSSDQALKELFQYFEHREDPVVILFFGDHWPKLEEGFVSQLLREKRGFEVTMAQYQVPFFIWANYPLEAQEIQRVSLNYLSGLLLRAAGLEGTGYTKYLEGLRRTLPVITDIGMMDSRGSLYRSGERSPYDSLLRDYAALQYNNSFDGDKKLESFFSRQAAGKAERDEPQAGKHT